MFTIKISKSLIKKSKRYCTKIQYISDLHVDEKIFIPNIMPKSDYLCIAGDIGVPTHPNYNKLLNDVSNKFKKVFIVAGNHEYGLSPLYDESAILKYQPLLKEVCSNYNNIYLLDNSFYQLTDSTIIAGTTLWSNLVYVSKKYPNNVNYINHIKIFNKNINWINHICRNHKRIIMMTHFVPSFQLIEQHYKNKGPGRND